MNVNPAEFLRKLGGGVRPDGTAPTFQATGVEHADFASLLDEAHAGRFGSAQPVSVARGAKVELSSGQLDRLAAATDAAEAAGAQRLLAMIDGKGVMIDVPTRTVTGGVEGLGNRLITNVDAFVLVPEGSAASLRALFASSPSEGQQRVAGFPGLDSVRNDSLAVLLERLGSNGHSTEPPQDPQSLEGRGEGATT